jgi:hypothetical protein
VRALPRVPAGRRRGRRGAGQLAHGHGVVVGCPVPEGGTRDAGQPQLAGRDRSRFGERRQGERVGPRPDRAVPAQPLAVRPATPAGRVPGEPAQAGQQGPRRGGRPRSRGGEPGTRAQQVHREVGGELDGGLELGVHPDGRRRDRDDGHRDDGYRDDGHRDDGARRGGPVRPAAEPVDAQRGAAPGQVGAVGTGAPTGDAQPELPPPRRLRRVDRGRRGRTGGRGGSARRVHAQHTQRQPDRQPTGQARRRARRRVERPGRAGAEQLGGDGPPGSRDGGAADRCCLDRHRCPPGT